jgi:hypothetical protein
MPTKPPLSDAEFHLYLDAVGRLVQPQQFRVAVYQGGVESSLRPVVWRHLLNIYPGDMNGRERFDYVRQKSVEYYRLRDEWLSRESTDPGVQQVVGMIRKDVHRTDRLHAFYAGDNNPNGRALFNMLVTFALTHPLLSYWQGMSDIASPILAVQTDEATAYVCFCALMRRLGASFAADGGVMAARFRQLALLVRHFDAEFYSHICRCGASDMFFTYRWLLLEMKREFPLDDAMYALEVMWSSLPLDPPENDLPLYDAAYLKSGAFVVSPVTNQTEAYVHLRSTQRRLSGSCSQSVNGTSGSPSTGCQKSNGVVVSKPAVKSASLPHSAGRDMTAVNERDEGKTGDSSKTPDDTSSCKSGSAPASRPENISQDTDDRSQASANRSSSVNASSQSTARVSPGIAANHRLGDQSIPSASISPAPEAAAIHADEADLEDADEQTKLLDESSQNVSLSYVQVSRSGAEIVPLLPPPSELGCGNPFLMFLCLSTLLLQRNRVMATCVDYNDVAMHYDKMVRQHRVELVVQYARQLYATYLKQQQLQQQSLRNDADDEHEHGGSHDY